MPFYGEIPEHMVDPTESLPFDTSVEICAWCAGANGWQPIETAPDREDGVLVCDASKPHPAVGVARFIDGRWRGYDHGMGVEALWPTPTHWMSLPEPPPCDSDGTPTGAINEDLSVPQDCQARAESIARKELP